MIFALNFLPVSHIQDGFLDMTECKDECDEESCTKGCVAKEVPDAFCNYFDFSYIGILHGRGKNQKRKTPRFPPSFWSVYDRLRANMPRTNNEGNVAFLRECQSSIFLLFHQFVPPDKSMRMTNGLATRGSEFRFCHNLSLFRQMSVNYLADFCLLFVSEI